MTNTILYLPISSMSLPHYFGRGIILPSKYYINKPDDLQSRYNGAIFLSSEIWTSGADCALEIIFNEFEQRNLIPLGSGFLFSGAMPISRVKAIYFLEQEQKTLTVYNTNSGAAFIPDELVKVVFPLENKQIIEPYQTDMKIEVQELYDKAKRFDILLGGMAFMRLGHKDGYNFPKDYFSTLAYFNQIIKEELINADKAGLVDYDDFLTGVFINKKNTKWSGWQSLIFENVDIEQVEKLALKDKIKIEKKYGSIQFENLNPNSYIYDLSILATYGNKKSRSVEELINLLQSDQIDEIKSEEIALIFGLHTRYSGLRNAYNRGTVTPAKFKLDSQLDYYTIESVFQFVFNNNKENTSFDYLDFWIPRRTPIIKEDVPYYQILDVDVLSKKKITAEKLYSQNIEKHVKELQSRIGDFGKFIFNQTKESVELSLTKEIEKLQVENNYLKEQLEQLTTKLELDALELQAYNFNLRDIPFEEKPTEIPSDDNLEGMELKDLKKIAKSKKISALKLASIKPTKRGLQELIGLIRNAQTLL